MAYKARRTRDLQGEVQAGTNVSVSETTRPDGTKVFTLSADSGEIQTLADMSNSIAMFDISTGSHKDGGMNYYIPEDIGITDIQTIGNFYQKEETQLIIDGQNVYGINILNNGIYRVSTTIELDIPTTSAINSILYLYIIKIDENGNWQDLITYAASPTQKTTTQYYCTFNVDTLIKVNSGDIISFKAEVFDTNIEDLFTLSNNPLFAIQKIR